MRELKIKIFVIVKRGDYSKIVVLRIRIMYEFSGFVEIAIIDNAPTNFT